MSKSHKGTVFSSRSKHAVLAHEAKWRFQPLPDAKLLRPPLKPIDWGISLNPEGNMADRLLRGLIGSKGPAVSESIDPKVLGSILRWGAFTDPSRQLLQSKYVLTVCSWLIENVNDGTLTLAERDWIPISVRPQSIVTEALKKQDCIICIERYDGEPCVGSLPTTALGGPYQMPYLA